MSAAAAQLVLPTPLAEEHAGWPFVTVLSSRSNHSYRTEAVNISFRDGALFGFRWYTSWGHSEIALGEHENIVWVRGWHESDSPEVKALIAAWALT